MEGQMLGFEPFCGNGSSHFKTLFNEWEGKKILARNAESGTTSEKNGELLKLNIPNYSIY